MRIGIVLTAGPVNGGTYQYSRSVLNALRDYGQDHEYVVFYDSPEFPTHEYASPHWTLHHYGKTDNNLVVKAARLMSTMGLTFFSPLARGRHQILLSYDLDLVICPSTTPAAWWCGLPFIVAIHDIWHRRKLPGTSMFSEPFRDIIWRRAAGSARIVLVESELGKAEIVSAYQIRDSKVHILPTGPATFIWNCDPAQETAVRKKYELPECYVFYPGGLAPAKNQRRVIEAIAILWKEHGLNIHAVFTGSAGSPYADKMRTIARTEGIDQSIHFLGMVRDEEMPLLYRGALCLTMASYIGPTNMPIWEAFAIGCPVVSSNTGAMPDQVGDAGLLFDPSDAKQLAECILRIYSDKQFVITLTERAYERVKPLRPETWARSLFQAIEDATQ